MVQQGLTPWLALSVGPSQVLVSVKGPGSARWHSPAMGAEQSCKNPPGYREVINRRAARGQLQLQEASCSALHYNGTQLLGSELGGLSR